MLYFENESGNEPGVFCFVCLFVCFVHGKVRGRARTLNISGCNKQKQDAKGTVEMHAELKAKIEGHMDKQ